LFSEPSVGAVLLVALYAHHYKIAFSIEWILFVVLIDNAILSAARWFGRKQQGKKQKKE
jgi:hypothetical protein